MNLEVLERIWELAEWIISMCYLYKKGEIDILVQHGMCRDDEGCCFCRNAGWEIVKRSFFSLSKEETKIQKIPPGEGTRKRLVYSRETKAMGAESLAGEEHGVSVLATLV